MRARSIRRLGLVACLLAGCGGSGGEDDAAAEPLRGVEGAEAAAQAALSLAGAVSVLLVDSPAAQSATAMAASPSAAEAGGETRAVRSPCPLGGNLDANCREEKGRTILTSDLSDCVVAEQDIGLVFTSNGRLSLAVEAPGLCGRPIPTEVRVTTEMRDFTTITESFDGVVEELTVPRLTQRFESRAPGCGGRDGITTLTGRLMVRRSSGVDVNLEMRRLVLAVRSRGNPCQQTAEVEGDLALHDRLRERDFDLALAEVLVSSEIGGAADGLIHIAGVIESPCFGTAEIATEEMLAGDAACPDLGSIAVTLDDGERLRALFSPTGEALDYGVDGEVDVESESCFAGSNPCGQ